MKPFLRIQALTPHKKHKNPIQNQVHTTRIDQETNLKSPGFDSFGKNSRTQFKTKSITSKFDGFQAAYQKFKLPGHLEQENAPSNILDGNPSPPAVTWGRIYRGLQRLCGVHRLPGVVQVVGIRVLNNIFPVQEHDKDMLCEKRRLRLLTSFKGTSWLWPFFLTKWPISKAINCSGPFCALHPTWHFYFRTRSRWLFTWRLTMLQCSETKLLREKHRTT